jgi:capsular exopolysaccharide synthesis family protein
MARNKQDKRNIDADRKNLISDETPFRIVEAYKNLRANLLFSLSTSGNHTVIFSSSEPNAGKSFTCANLAITMAQTGTRVLVVDADLRKPIMHRLFRRENEDGLSRLLSGQTVEINGLLQREVMTGVDLVTAGPVPPNPSELLGHVRAKQILEAFTKAYDYIFIDTPPLNMVSDALLLMPYTAGVLLVARQGQTHLADLHEAAARCQSFGTAPLGIVISDTQAGANSYYGKYGYYNYEYA